ncbi:hypothetical protein KAK07_11840 [Ideonella sp. 4Y16]|uniref:hypothetical protein n=1 Tax=Ideonella alba TaxID=2824118 RepID=UPI001B36C2C5|nr:hypothetical protein [Ideonella alba]MBQ0944026.1 hypothetical protein [Ideonella alba]
MSPDEILRHLATIHPAAQRPGLALQALLPRSGPLAPPLLDLAYRLPRLPGVADGAAKLQAALSALNDVPPPMTNTGTLLAWAEPPAVQVRRVVDAVLAGASGQPVADLAVRAAERAREDGLQFGLTPQQAAHAARAAATSLHWLAAAHPGAVGDRGWQPPAAEEHCSLPLALLDSAGRGVAGSLVLWRVRQPGARLCLAPAPASTLLLRAATAEHIDKGATWDAALANVSDRLHFLLDSAASTVPAGHSHFNDTAIAWSVALRRGQPLDVLQGDSAGAALLLGAAWLLRRHLQPSWRNLLLRLVASDLHGTACSAALGHGMELKPVGGAVEKAEALHDLARLVTGEHGAPRVVLHVSRGQALPDMPDGMVSLKQSHTMLALLQKVVQAADPLEPEQAALLDILRDRDPDAEAPLAVDAFDRATDPDSAGTSPASADRETTAAQLLDAVHLQPTNRLRTWLLHCWASWERDLGGRVQQRHVLLKVKPDLKGEGQGQPQLDDDSAGTLPGLLQRFDTLNAFHAYTLRGQTGSGKSTLLRHYLQRSAHRLLLALEALSSAQGGPRMDHTSGALLPADACELPVYLSVGDMPRELLRMTISAQSRQKVWQWVLTVFREQGAPEPLLHLLEGRGEWAALGLRPRLLLDDLDALDVSEQEYRPAFAAMVLEAVKERLAASTPFVAACRTDLRIEASGVRLLRLDVLPWQPHEVGKYLLRRLGTSEGTKKLAYLKQVPAALDLCGSPIHLVLQCELWERGVDVPLEDITGLYAWWLWMRLNRALYPPDHASIATCWSESLPHDQGDPANPKHPDHAQHVLLTSGDREVIQRFPGQDSVIRQNLPMQGRLLRELMAEALRQIGLEQSGRPVLDQSVPTAARIHETGSDSHGRPRPLVAPDLPEPLRQRFAQACVELGIVQKDHAANNGWQFKFSHPGWREFFASLALPLIAGSVVANKAKRLSPARNRSPAASRGKSLSRRPILPGRHWCEFRIGGVEYRLLPSRTGPILHPSSRGAMGQFASGISLVVDADGRVCAQAQDGLLQIAFLNRYAPSIERWRVLDIPGDLRLLGIAMRGERRVEIVATGKQGLRTIRAEYPGTGSGSHWVSDEDASGPCRSAIFHRVGSAEAKAVVIDADGRPTSGDVSFGLDSIEFLDAGTTTDAGLIYAAIGRHGGDSCLVTVSPAVSSLRRAELRLRCGAPKGLVVIRNGLAADCVLVQVDGRLFSMKELQEMPEHAPS